MTITLYTKPGCPQCMVTKRWLSQHNIEDYKVVDIMSDQNKLEYVKATYGPAMPLLVVNEGKENEEYTQGFRPNMFSDLLLEKETNTATA